MQQSLLRLILGVTIFASCFGSCLSFQRAQFGPGKVSMSGSGRRPGQQTSLTMRPKGAGSQPESDENEVNVNNGQDPASKGYNKMNDRSNLSLPGLIEAVRVGTAKHTRTLVAGSAAVVLLWRRDALAISVLTGAIANAIFSKVLKRILNQRRPDGAPVSDPGMPSSHAMSLFFFASYLSAASLVWMPENVSVFVRLAACSFLAVFAVNSATWRVEAGFHTSEQVFVGSVVGSIDGLLWFLATHKNWNLIENLDKTLAESNASAYAIRCVCMHPYSGETPRDRTRLHVNDHLELCACPPCTCIHSPDRKQYAHTQFCPDLGRRRRRFRGKKARQIHALQEERF